MREDYLKPHMSENDFMDGEVDVFATSIFHDNRWHYEGYHGCPSLCHLRIYRPLQPRPLYIVFTEIGSNQGTSVTNRIEALASDVWRRLPTWNKRKSVYTPLPLDKVPIWIEHYPNRGRFNPHTRRWQIPESFDFVEMHQKADGSFVQPKWVHTSRRAVEMILSREFDPIPEPTKA
jgi:hypothetical protein